MIFAHYKGFCRAILTRQRTNHQVVASAKHCWKTLLLNAKSLAVKIIPSTAGGDVNLHELFEYDSQMRAKWCSSNICMKFWAFWCYCASENRNHSGKHKLTHLCPWLSSARNFKESKSCCVSVLVKWRIWNPQSLLGNSEPQIFRLTLGINQWKIVIQSPTWDCHHNETAKQEQMHWQIFVP